MNKLEKRAVFLNSIFSLGNSLAGLFLNIYLYAYTNSLMIMSIYTIIRISMFPFFFTLSMKITKKYNFVLTYAIGLFLMTCSLLYALIGSPLFVSNPNLVLFTALISGIGEGFYWYSSNTASQVISSTESRARYLSVNGVFSNISCLLAPVLSNLILGSFKDEIEGYRYILLTTICLYVIVIFISLSLNIKNNDKDVSIFKVLSLKNDVVWRKLNIGVVLYGMKESLSLTLTNILVFEAAGSGGIYSRLQLLFSFITILSYILIARRLDRTRVEKTFKIGVLLTITSTLILVYVKNIYGAIIFGITNSLSAVYYTNTYSYLSANVIGRYNEELNARVVARETYLSFGRCFGMAIIVLAYLYLPHEYSLKIAVTFLSIMPLIVERLLLSIR